MEKEEIFSGLNERLGSTQLSERTLSEYASAISSEFSDETNVTDDLWAKHVGILKSLNGNLHKDVSAEIKKWRDSHPAPEQEENEEESTTEEPVSSDAPEWFSKFSNSIDERFKAIEREREKERSARADAEFRSAVESGFRSKFADAGVKIHDYQFKNALKEVEMDSGKGVEACIEDLEKLYNAHLKASGVSDYGYPRRGSVGGSRTGNSPQDDFFRRKASKEGWLKEGK